MKIDSGSSSSSFSTRSAAGTVRLVIIDDIFKKNRITKIIDRPATLADLFDLHLERGPNWHLIVDGKRQKVDYRITSLDREVVARKVPAGGLFEIILFAAISAIISAGISYAIALLLGPPRRSNQNANGGSATHAWTGISNTFTQGTPIAAIYGDEHRVGGQWISLYRKSPDGQNDNYLYGLLSLGFGPLQNIGGYTTDMDGLIAGGLFQDSFNTGAATLDARENWVHISPNANGINITSSALQSVVSGSDTTGAYQCHEDIGLTDDNQYAEIKFVQFGSARIALAINVEDEDNFHGLEFGSFGPSVRLFKMVGGGKSYLASATVIAVDDVVAIWRYAGRVHVEVNGVEVAVADADTGLTSVFTGVVKYENHASSAMRLDDFACRAANTLPDGMQINGNDAQAYQDVFVHLRIGRDDQPAMSADWSKVVRAYSPQLNLTTAWTVYKYRSGVEAFDVNIDFPGGLWDQSGGGGISSETVVIEVEEGGVLGFNFTPVAGSPFTITEAITSPFTRTISVTGLAPGVNQRFRIRRTNVQQSLSSSLISDKAVLADVNEIVRDDVQKYDMNALVALKIRATEQLSGGTPIVTNLVAGLPVPTWDGVSGSVEEPFLIYQKSSNPAWIALDILLNRDRGLGNWVGIADIDFERFKAWADWCDEVVEYYEEDEEPIFVTIHTEAIVAGSSTVIVTDATAAGYFADGMFVRIEFENLNQVLTKTALGDGRFALTLYRPCEVDYPAGFRLSLVILGDQISEPRHRFNGVFDSEISAWDALTRVCRVGRAVPIKMGNKITVRWEAAGAVTQVISEANMIEDSFELTYLGSAERVDLMEVQFLDAANNYDQDVAIVGGFPPATSAHAPIRRTQELYGITSRAQARREGNYHLRAARLLRRKCKFAMALDGFTAEPGDVVAIASILPNWSLWTGRGSGTLASIRLSHDLTITSDVMVALVRTEDDPEGVLVNVVTPRGTVLTAGDELELDGDSGVIVDQSPIAIGTAESLTTLWRVIKTGINMKEMTIAIECVEYREDVYDLVGWTLDPGGILPIPAAGGCLEPGRQYFIPASFWDFGCSITPPVGCEGANCFNLTGCGTAITGDAASCISIISEDCEGNVVIEVADPCAGTNVCIEKSITGFWSFNPPGCPCPADSSSACTDWPGVVLCHVGCSDSDEGCWTICP